MKFLYAAIAFILGAGVFILNFSQIFGVVLFELPSRKKAITLGIHRNDKKSALPLFTIILNISFFLLVCVLYLTIFSDYVIWFALGFFFSLIVNATNLKKSFAPDSNSIASFFRRHNSYFTTEFQRILKSDSVEDQERVHQVINKIWGADL